MNVPRRIDEAQRLLAAYDDAMASQANNMADEKLIVMANYGDLCASELRFILAQSGRFSWKFARTQVHLHMDDNFTGISLPIRAKHPELAAWRDEVIAVLGLPNLAAAKTGGAS